MPASLRFKSVKLDSDTKLTNKKINYLLKWILLNKRKTLWALNK